jgi:predicted aspartyl protease
MPVRINGQPANLLVDTGATGVILDADSATSLGIQPSQRGLRYIRFNEINGQELPLGFAQNVAAADMNFGSVFVSLRNSSYSGTGNAHIDGVLGLDILCRYKAVINCRTKLVFFKVDQSRQIELSSVASAEKFTRIPLRREENGTLTVPCSVNGQGARLLVDTGAFITTFDNLLLNPLASRWNQQGCWRILRVEAREGLASDKSMILRLATSKCGRRNLVLPHYATSPCRTTTNESAESWGSKRCTITMRSSISTA